MGMFDSPMGGTSYWDTQTKYQTPTVSIIPAATSVFSGSSGWGTLFNALGAGASIYGAYKSYEQGKSLAEAFTSTSRRNSQLQEQAQSEQRAEQAAKAAGERRQQLREERVKRSKVMQASANTGTSGSSGEAGALGSLSTQLSSNVGFNLGAQQTAASLTNINQEIANSSGAYQELANQPNNFNLLSQVGTSIFGASGGFNTLSNIFK